MADSGEGACRGVVRCLVWWLMWTMEPLESEALLFTVEGHVGNRSGGFVALSSWGSVLNFSIAACFCILVQNWWCYVMI